MNILNSNVNALVNDSYSKNLQNNVNNIQKVAKDDALRHVCDDFESFFMKQILDVSFKNSKIAGEGVGSEIIKGMYTQSLSAQSNGNLGISDMLFQFLSQKKS